MNFSDIPTGKSPRRELQGPRPTPLSINKDSHKIKKPPPAPQRQPVIIYMVSPKIIHTTPDDFMSLVQRLTGSSSSSSSSTSYSSSSSFPSSSSHMVSNDPFNGNNDHGNLSPVASNAMIKKQNPSGGGGHVEGSGVERPSMFHGILSPGQASLSPIPSSFFSPDPNLVGFLHDLSPALHSSRNFMEGSFVTPSPSNFVSPHTPSIDLFNNFLDG